MAIDNNKIQVVGGSYIEECAFPRRCIFRGSGGRAAATLASLKVPTSLTTVLGPASADSFRGLSRMLQYDLNELIGKDDIRFRYRFPLGRPEIIPSVATPIKDDRRIDCDKALVFGMLEGRPVVHAKKAIYDPQDGYQSKPFQANGSEAKELAMVVSGSEGMALSQATDIEEIGEILLHSDPSVSTVIVKNGPWGAFVKTHSEQTWIKAFPSKSVYKIGSGDLFSAAFAYSWLYNDGNAVEAAWFASRLSAAYVETGQDQFEESDVTVFSQEASRAKRENPKLGRCTIRGAHVYLAGPFFTTAQQWLIDEVREAMQRMGFKVFSPFHDIGNSD